LGLQVRGPADLVALLEEEFRGCDREHFLAVLLDTRHRVTAVETVAIGCLDASLVHPREVYKTAVALGAAAVVAAHNHPSGSAQPSREDLGLTRRLARCGRLLGIELLDHIVIGQGEYTSLREHGWPGAGGDGADGNAPGVEGWRP
jgi:DNA repair protein RadC